MFVSLDGTDCPINEPTPFSTKWWSHKINGPGLRYEVGLCISTGHIVWTNGPYPCGAFPDLKIARDCYIDQVEQGEMTLADKGYRDATYFLTPWTHPESSGHQKRIMARHETVNGRLKFFAVLRRSFRHELHLHTQCFHAVANIVQLELKNGSPLFHVT